MTQRRHDISRSSLPRRRGFTLMELVTSMAIMGVIVLGLGSGIIMASYAIDDGTGSNTTQRKAREAADQIRADLTYALSFTERTWNAVTFTAPDRDGDSNPETIRYAWSGVAGDPLNREYNGCDPVPVAEEVHSFELSYLLRTTAAPVEGCGDGTCDTGEDRCTCPGDCGEPAPFEEPGVTCDDGVDNDCDGGADCDDINCFSDPACQAPPAPVCGNDICEAGEDCNTCGGDCSGKSTGPPSGQYCCGNGVLESAEGDGSICDGNP